MRAAREQAMPYASGIVPKLAPRDVTCLSDAELLAVILRTGDVGKPALDLAQELLEQHDGIGGLLHTAADDLTALRSPSKRAELQAILELTRRALHQRLRGRDVFSSPDAVKHFLQLSLARKPYEAFAVLFLDAQNALLEMNVMFRGTLTQTSVYPREIVKHALDVGCSSVILAHNHPSGTVQPSRADEALTQTIKAALALVDVRVLDHIIVVPGNALSMAEKGLV